MLERNMNKKTMAEKCGWTSAIFANKLRRDNWNKEDLQKVANALQTTIVVSYVPQETPEENK